MQFHTHVGGVWVGMRVRVGNVSCRRLVRPHGVECRQGLEGSGGVGQNV